MAPEEDLRVNELQRKVDSLRQKDRLQDKTIAKLQEDLGLVREALKNVSVHSVDM